MHAICQNLNTEEEVENIADMGFDCTICRPYIPPTNDPPKTYTQDGVCLTESGMSQLQSLTVTVPRRKRTKPKLKLKIINQNSVAVLQTPPDAQSEHSRDGEMDDSREGDLMDCDGKSDSSPEREAVDDETKVAEGADGIKKGSENHIGLVLVDLWYVREVVRGRGRLKGLSPGKILLDLFLSSCLAEMKVGQNSCQTLQLRSLPQLLKVLRK